MTKPKEAKVSAADTKTAAPKKAAAAAAAAKPAAAKATEAPVTAAPTEAPKTAPEATQEAPKAAPEAPKTEEAKPEQEAPKSFLDDLNLGPVGEFLGAFGFGGQPVGFTFSSKDAEDETEEDESDIIARAMRMASHPSFGRISGELFDSVRDFAEDVADTLFNGQDGFPEGGCCMDEFAQQSAAQPVTLVERDGVTQSMGHLVELKKLHDAGILTDAEYTAKKTDILRTIY